MATSFREYKAQVLAASDIEAVMKEYGVPVISHMAVCPFHPDSTPSMSVHRQRQYFHCFAASCGKAGDVIRFVELMDGLRFRDALDKLALRAGIPIFQPHAADAAAEELDRQVLALIAYAASYYANGWTPEAQRYVTEERGLPADLIAKHGLGWADPEAPSWASVLAQAWGISWLPVAEYAGLIGLHGLQSYDRMSRRITFPLFAQERPVGITGRMVGPSYPKYLHTKGEALPLYLEDALNPNQVYVTEGPLDALSLTAWGLPTVALLGGPRPTVIPKLRRVRQVMAVLDADEAGVRATMKLATALDDSVRCVLLPEGMDPNDYARAHTLEEFQALQVVAPIELVMRTYAPPPAPTVGFSTYLAPVISYLAGLSDLTRTIYVEQVLRPAYDLSALATRALLAEITTFQSSRLQCPVCGTVVRHGH